MSDNKKERGKLRKLIGYRIGTDYLKKARIARTEDKDGSRKYGSTSPLENREHRCSEVDQLKIKTLEQSRLMSGLFF
jgi:hypothetical protein